MKIKDAISTGYILVKAAGCLGNYAANSPRPWVGKHMSVICTFL